MSLIECPDSKLLLPREFVDQRKALASTIHEWLEKVTNSMKHIKESYFLMFQGTFDKLDPTQFKIGEPKVSFKLPPFKSNQIVWWICPKRGIRELLWIVPPHKRGEKLRVEFNKEGVAYLQAKGAMPSRSGKNV